MTNPTAFSLQFSQIYPRDYHRKELLSTPQRFRLQNCRGWQSDNLSSIHVLWDPHAQLHGDFALNEGVSRRDQHRT